MWYLDVDPRSYLYCALVARPQLSKKGGGIDTFEGRAFTRDLLYKSFGSFS